MTEHRSVITKVWKLNVENIDGTRRAFVTFSARPGTEEKHEIKSVKILHTPFSWKFFTEYNGTPQSNIYILGPKVRYEPWPGYKIRSPGIINSFFVENGIQFV